MKILYLANIRLPTEKAHGIQIMKTCEALSKTGDDIELVVTNRRTPINESPFEYYRVVKPFALTRLAVVDTVRWGKLGFALETRSFALAANRLLLRRTPDVIFGRDEQVLARLKTDLPIVWETHTGAWSSAAKSVAQRAHRIITISQGLKDFYIAQGVPAGKIAVAHDGVDVEQFNLSLSRAEARAKLGLNPIRPLVVYTGSRQAIKGVRTLEEAGALLPDIELLIISGKPQKEIPLYLHAADLLVLPNSGADIVSSRFTSPMKLFEYMASGTPIVASNVPSIREVLDVTMAELVSPDDPKALAEGIRAALADPESWQRADVARRKVAEYSWDSRADTILKEIYKTTV